jgi:hypothetical protein
MKFHAMKPRRKTPPRLIQCATLWSLIGWPSARRPWSQERQLAAVKAAGFDGVAAGASPGLKAEADRLGLLVLSGISAGSLAQALPALRVHKKLGIPLINVQWMDEDTPPATAARGVLPLLRAGRELGLKLHIETHRDTSTETPEKFTDIARRYRKATGELMPVTWDHSHFAVSKHMLPPDYARRLLAWPRLIQNSQIFHLRPFNSQHCQVQVTNGRGRLTPEFLSYLGFVEELFTLWLRGPRPGGELWTCPELGMSHGYHLSTDHHPWPDVIVARRAYAGAWRRALKRAGF